MKLNKIFFFLMLVFGTLAACESTTEEDNERPELRDTIPQNDEIQSEIHQNERFRNVRVTRTEEDTYRVTGEASVFEANVRYVVEDGHYELAEGFTTASIAAPEWGLFEFTINVEKVNQHSTLMLILFEESAKDGSRQHELFIPLPEEGSLVS